MRGFIKIHFEQQLFYSFKVCLYHLYKAEAEIWDSEIPHHCFWFMFPYTPLRAPHLGLYHEVIPDNL